MASVFLEDIKYLNQWRSEDVDFLLGNILQRVDFEATVRFENFVAPTTDLTVTFEPSDLLDPTGWIRDDINIGRFQNFYVGDTFNVDAGPRAGNYTITEKTDDNLIRTTGLTPGEITYTANFLKNTTPINGVKFWTNLIENSSATNYNSLTSNQAQAFEIDSADDTNTSPQDMAPLGSKSWQFSTDSTGLTTGATIEGLNDATFQKFKIKWTTFVVPIFLQGQQDDPAAPSYFLNDSALKHIFKVDLKPFSNDPNRLYTLEIDTSNGNTGWYDERFNGQTNNYSVDNFVIEKVSDSSNIDQLELFDNGTDTYNITFDVNNTEDTPFSAGNTQAALSFAALLQDQTQYIQAPSQSDYLDKNFCFDQAFQTEGAATVNGFQFGTTRQSITDFAFTFQNSGQISVSATISMDAGAVAKINTGTAKQYVIAFAVQDHTIETGSADLVQLLVQESDFTTQFVNSNAVTAGSTFLDHSTNDIETNGALDCFYPEDNIVVKTDFNLDRTNGAVIENIVGKLIARKNSGEEFDLETFSQAFITDDSNIVGGTQLVDFETQNALRIPTNEIRRDTKLTRIQANDAAPLYAYRLQHPITMRWEDWVAKMGVDGEFYDQTENQDGRNEEWVRYELTTDWSIVYQFIVTVTEDDYTFTLEPFEKTLELADYNTNDDWITEDVLCLDPDTLVEIPGSQLYIDTDTMIQAKITKPIAAPDVSQVYFIIRMEVFEEGGKNSISRLSNIYETDGNGILKSVDEALYENIVKVEKSGNEYTGTCLVDYTKLPQGATQYKISARIAQIP